MSLPIGPQPQPQDTPSLQDTQHPPSPFSACYVNDWEEPCVNYEGISLCNKYFQKCVKAKGNRWGLMSLTNVYKGENNVCASKGAFMAPDAAVVIIAQIIFSGIFLIVGFVLTVIACKATLPPCVIGVTGALLVFCLILLFSYYYLNAIVMMTCAFGACALYSTKNAGATSAGMLLCLLALFWVTFQFGLGNVQHHSRKNAGSSYSDFYEQTCDSYYRGYFFIPNVVMEDDWNPAIQYAGFCNRHWLAAELFFMIMSQLLLVLLVATGGVAFFNAGFFAKQPNGANAPDSDTKEMKQETNTEEKKEDGETKA